MPSPAWPSQDLSSASQATIAHLQEGRENKSCRTEIATWSNSVEQKIYKKIQHKIKKTHRRGEGKLIAHARALDKETKPEHC